jgi:glutamate carboxypeptidase
MANTRRQNGGTRAILAWVLVLLSCEPRPGQHAPPEAAVAPPVSSQAPRPDEPLLRAAQDGVPALVRELTTLVNLDSGSDDAGGLSHLADLLEGRLRDLGAVVEVLAAPPSAGRVVRGTLGGTGTARIMLMVHYDTVFPAGEANRRPMRIDGHRAFGPGVADAKGGIAIILRALEIARQRRFNEYKTLTVVFNPDEEKSSPGSRDMLRTWAAQQDVVLSYEPPDAERVIVATNGIAHLHLNVQGRASHAGSAPEKGRNAAVELAGQIMQLEDLGNAARGTTVNFTILQSGDRINMIPDKATATADVRMSDLSELERVRSDANRIIRKHFVPDTSVTIAIESRRPPFIRNPASDHLALLAQQVYRELDKALDPVAMRYGTDAGFAFQPGSAKPAVLEGLGIVGDGLHSPDEWADLDSVAPRIYLTIRMLESLSE